ncbi:alpha/beta fold hydrolase [Salinithrix halophila]|uniref:Alpha/beta fold hydrolase n=1 Tax=Salinithrix halophila TaxID=1485204 RepID=A0ABV8JD09_9BACL
MISPHSHPSLHCRFFGAGPAVLFLHGIGTGWRLWKPQIPAFSPFFRMILPDLRGHGLSPPLPRDFTYDMMADDLAILLDEANIKKAHVVGLSMGAIVAQCFTLRYPERVDRLVLADGYCDMPDRFTAFCMHSSTPLCYLLPWSLIQWLAIHIHRGDDREARLTKEVLKDSLTIDKKTFLRLKKKFPPDLSPLLHRIHVPTMILGGEGLEVEKRGSLMLHRRIIHSRLAFFHHAFDPLNTMAQDSFDSLVLDFLQGRPMKRYPGVQFKLRQETGRDT